MFTRKASWPLVALCIIFLFFGAKIQPQKMAMPKGPFTSQVERYNCWPVRRTPFHDESGTADEVHPSVYIQLAE